MRKAATTRAVQHVGQKKCGNPLRGFSSVGTLFHSSWNDGYIDLGHQKIACPREIREYEYLEYLQVGIFQEILVAPLVFLL